MLPKECQDSVIGAEGTIWTEMINDYVITERILPRIWAIGARTWNNGPSYPEANSYEGSLIWRNELQTMRDKTK